MRLLFSLLVLTVATASGVSSQPYYNGLEETPEREPSASPGVRVGLGVGAYVYRGPNLLTGDAAFQRDVVATNLGVTAEVTAPLRGDRLYGRLTGGLLNIGADDTRADVSPRGANPFLTSPTVLAEADLLYYLLPPGGGAVAPYLFSGLSGLFATGDGIDGVGRTALAVPVGVGVEVGATRNLSLFAEASYRFGITDVSGDAFVVRGALRSPDVCDKESPDFDEAKCEAKGGTPIPTCEQDPTQDRCREVLDDRDSLFDDRFGSGLVLGGLRLGFAPAPPAPIPPPPPPAVVPEPAPEPEVPLVCDLIELNSVTFDYGSTTLDTRARRLLDENVELLLSSPACCVFVDGYVDESEFDAFGAPVADRRARAVYSYYLSRGVDGDRLNVRNRGLAVPSCDKEDPGPGCERNRRVESLPVDCERFRLLIEDPSYDPY